MSYQVLARKWRPSNFAQVAGQAHVLKSLINALDNERLHHAYLFTGTRGVGKTTLARILAKCLNCETGIRSVPCEECSACKEINQGRFIDLIEVDAASRTKVEDTRELLDNVQYTPSRGRFKVYLIDEVHMLSNHSFNALLKTLEEPPPHVKFLLATTDPQKLPITILSRCLQFNLKNLSPQLIAEYLQQVLKAEGIEFDEESLWQIAGAASGSMRDALTLVDQAISYCQGEINHKGVVEMLGVPEQRQVHALLSAMAAGHIREVLSLVTAMSEHTPDYGHTLDSLLSTLHRLAISQVAPKSIDNSFGDKQLIEELASRFTAEDIQLFYQLGSRGRTELRMASDMKAAFEMLLIRMMLFSPSIVGDDLSPLPEEGQEADAGTAEQVKKKPELSAPAVDSQPIQVSPAAAEKNARNSVQEEARRDPGQTQPTQAAVEDRTVEVACEDNTAPEPLPDSPDAGLVASQDSSDDDGSAMATVALGALDHSTWLRVAPGLKLSGIAANIIANCTVSGVSGSRIELTLDTEQSAVFSEEIVPRLEQALSDYFQQSVAVQVIIDKAESETPAQMAQRLKKKEHEQMIEDFEQDDNVRQLLDTFSATIAKDSITPLEN